MPHKVAALRHVHKHHDPSFPIEPVNMAIPRNGRIEGVNSDINGLVEPLLAHGAGRIGGGGGPAIVVGAGGVLYSVMWTLAALGFAPIWIVMRDADKAAQVARDYKGVNGRPISFEGPLPGARLLVNATPLGMAGFPDFPLPLELAGAPMHSSSISPTIRSTRICFRPRGRGGCAPSTDSPC